MSTKKNANASSEAHTNSDSAGANASPELAPNITGTPPAAEPESAVRVEVPAGIPVAPPTVGSVAATSSADAAAADGVTLSPATEPQTAASIEVPVDTTSTPSARSVSLPIDHDAIWKELTKDLVPEEREKTNEEKILPWKEHFRTSRAGGASWKKLVETAAKHPINAKVSEATLAKYVGGGKRTGGGKKRKGKKA